MICANASLFRKETVSMSGTQENLLKAVAEGEFHLTPAAVMRRFSLGATGNAAKNGISSFGTNVFTKKKGATIFGYPAFGLWFNKQFFGREYTLDIT